MVFSTAIIIIAKQVYARCFDISYYRIELKEAIVMCSEKHLGNNGVIVGFD